MGIPFHDHCGLCVPGVTLNSFNVATAEFKFVGRAGVPETMKYHFGEIIFRDEFVKGPVDVICFGRGALGRNTFRTLVLVFGSFRASTVELHPRIVGNLNMIPFSPICASDSLEIR